MLDRLRTCHSCLLRSLIREVRGDSAELACIVDCSFHYVSVFLTGTLWFSKPTDFARAIGYVSLRGKRRLKDGLRLRFVGSVLDIVQSWVND